MLNVTEAKVLPTVIGPKTGRACETSILGLFTFGNSGYKAAAANGGISQIEGSDYSSKAILGLWAEHCTLVYGR